MLLDLDPPLSSLLLLPDLNLQKLETSLSNEENNSIWAGLRQSFMNSTNPISTTTLAVCRWEWCKESFNTQDELVEHVLQEHIDKAVPIKKKDLPLERRALLGESFEDSISTTYLMNEAMFLNEDDKDNVRRSMAHLAAPGIRLSTPSRNTAPGTPPRRGISSMSPQLNSFRALSEASSPARSPDPSSMHVGQSPSAAELIASILNSGNPNRRTMSPIRGLSAGPSRQGHSQLLTPGERREWSKEAMSPRSFRMRTGGKPPSSLKKNAAPVSRKSLDRVTPTPLTRVLELGANGVEGSSSVVVKSEEENPDVGLALQSGGSDLQSKPRSQSRSRSRSLQPIAVIRSVRETEGRNQSQQESSILQTVEEEELQAASLQQQNSQAAPSSSGLPAHSRPFHTGTLELNEDTSTLQSQTLPVTMEPEAQPMEVQGPSESRDQDVLLNTFSEPILSQSQSELQLEPQLHKEPAPVPQATTDIYVPEVDMLHSSLEPSIPVFTQVGGDSQWPIQTQASFSFDSQLDLDTQSQQSQWLSHEPLSSGLGGS